MVGWVALLAVAAAVSAGMVRRHWWLTRIRSWSMYPGLRPGEHVVTRAIRRSDGIRRGDVVVIDSTELGRRVVKRVVGLPGETVRIAPGGVTVDGRRLNEPYPMIAGGPTGTFRVPSGAFLVLGDNRARSSDSRAWRQPYLPAAAIRGRLTGRRGRSPLPGPGSLRRRGKDR